MLMHLIRKLLSLSLELLNHIMRMGFCTTHRRVITACFSVELHDKSDSLCSSDFSKHCVVQSLSSATAILLVLIGQHKVLCTSTF